MIKNSQIQTRKKYPKTTANTKQNTKKDKSTIQQQEEVRNTGDEIPDDWTGEVVYLEPVDYEQPTQQHPVDVGKCLKSKQITGFKDILRIGKFRFKVTFESTLQARKAAGTTMQEHNLKCFVPQMFRQSIGLIKSVPWKYGEKELLEELQADVPILKVERMLRMDETQKLTHTQNVRVTFKGKELPNFVWMYGYKIRVELYLFPVKQCRNCWGYGHKTQNCKRVKKCSKCGQQADKHGEQCNQSCINCHGNHSADSKHCPERQKQKRIAEKMQQEKLTYQEARGTFLQNRYQLLQDYDEDFPSIAAGDDGSEAGTTATENRRTWRPRKTQRAGENQVAKQSGQDRQRDAEQRSQNRNRRNAQAIENPYRSSEVERMRMEMKAFWKNVALVGKLKQLQEAIKEQVGTKRTDISYEEIIIKISTVMGEIVEEIVSNMATSEESINRESVEENSYNNGE